MVYFFFFFLSGKNINYFNLCLRSNSTLQSDTFIRTISKWYFHLHLRYFYKSDPFRSSRDKSFTDPYFDDKTPTRRYVINVLSNWFHGTFDRSKVRELENLTHDFSTLIFHRAHNRFIIRPNSYHSLVGARHQEPYPIPARKRTRTSTLAGYPSEQSSRWPILGNVPTRCSKLRCLIKSRLELPRAREFRISCSRSAIRPPIIRTFGTFSTPPRVRIWVTVLPIFQ